MIYQGETKQGARKRHRRELETQGIKIGCRVPKSAKADYIKKNGDQRQGKCLVCGLPAQKCACDDRSEWVKRRI